MHEFHLSIAAPRASILHNDLSMNSFALLVYLSTLEDAWMRTLIRSRAVLLPCQGSASDLSLKQAEGRFKAETERPGRRFTTMQFFRSIGP